MTCPTRRLPTENLYGCTGKTKISGLFPSHVTISTRMDPRFWSTETELEEAIELSEILERPRELQPSLGPGVQTTASY